MLINNKVKQYYKGNWGKPVKLEQGLKLSSINLEPRYIPGKKKRRKQGSHRRVYDGFCCPFCHKELPLDEEYIAKEKKKCEGKPYTIIT